MPSISFGIGCSACGAHKTIGILSLVPDTYDAIQAGWRAATMIPGGYYCPDHAIRASMLMRSEQDTRHIMYEKAYGLYESVRERNDDNA